MSGIDVNPAYPPFDPDGDETPDEAAPEVSPAYELTDAPEGNRPAEGARQGSPGEVLSEDFVGGQNAGDFLGLDLEFEAPGAAPELELVEPTPAPPGAELDLAPAPVDAPALATGEPAPASLGHIDFQPEVDGEVPAAGELEDELADGELAGGEDDLGLDGAEPVEGAEGAEGEWDEPEVALAGGRGRLVLLTAAVACLAFAGVWFGRGLIGPGGDGPPLPAAGAAAGGEAVADAGGGGAAPAAEVAPAADPLEAEVAPVEDFGLAPTVGPPAPAVEVAGGPDPLVQLTDLLHAALVEAPGAESAGLASRGTPEAGQGAPADPRVTLVESEGLEAVPGEAPLGEAPGAEPTTAFFESLDWGDPASLDIVWREETIPMEAVSSPARVMLPRVGRVRVTLNSGEVLDGSLVALGQGRVWVDAHVGRIGLDAALVAGIERLAGPAPLDPHRVEVAAGDRVMIRLPGGTIYARVLSSQEDGRVTVATDAGARITLRDPEIERVATTRVQLVDDGTL